MAISRTNAATAESSPASSSNSFRPIRPIEYFGPKTISTQCSRRGSMEMARTASAPPQTILASAASDICSFSVAVVIVEPDDGHRFEQIGPAQPFHLRFGQHGQQPVHAAGIGQGAA